MWENDKISNVIPLPLQVLGHLSNGLQISFIISFTRVMLKETKFIIAGGGVLLVIILGISVAVLVVTVTVSTEEKELPYFETVSTLNGRVRGRLNRTLFDDKPYYSFRGIPYAKPPLRELRFKVSSG